MSLFFVVSLGCLAVVTASGQVASTGFSSAQEIVLPNVKYSDLKYSQEHIIQTQGIVAITEVPGLAEARSWAARSNARCVAVVSESEIDQHYVQRFAMQDGTTRYTFAAKDADPMDIPMELSDKFPECAELKLAAIALRGVFDEAVDAFVTGSLSPDSSTNQTDFERIHLHAEAVGGTTLDHFHAYQAESFRTEPEAAALQMHTDQGLFVVFTPARMVDGSGHELDTSAGAGFFVEMQDPNAPTRTQMYRAAFPSPDCVVIMFGQGAATLDPRVRPVPHAVHIPDLVRGSSHPVYRLWFGRMYLPSTSDPAAVLAEVKSSEVVGVGCGPGMSNKAATPTTPLLRSSVYRELQDAPDACDRAGVQYCWLMCFPIPECQSDEIAECLNSDNVLWDGKSHCTDCGLKCTSKPPEGPNGFCSGLVTNMYMDGFKGVGDEVDPCVLFLFRAFNLNSWGLFILGCIASFALGLLTEYLVKYRRQLHNKTKNQAITLKLKLRRTVFYTFAVFIGYIDMLIAMTYSGPLFASIILGLGAGHFLFNIETPVTESTDPCCIGEVEGMGTEGDSDSGKVKPQSNESSGDSQAANEEAASCCHNNNEVDSL